MSNDLRKQIDELSDKIAVLAKERAELRQQLAEISTPFKVGDRITETGAPIWEISKIVPGYDWSKTSEPHFYGRKIKKDGTPGGKVGRIWTYRDPLKLVAAT